MTSSPAAATAHPLIGSTSVPGLAAKPIIDIVIGIAWYPWPTPAVAAGTCLCFDMLLHFHRIKHSWTGWQPFPEGSRCVNLAEVPGGPGGFGSVAELAKIPKGRRRMRQLQITPLDGYDPEIGRWLCALQDVRHRYTLRFVRDLDERLVDWEGPDGQENAIGSLLYHIALVEMGWLYGDVKQMTELPPAAKQDFPFPGWEQSRNRLTRVLGVSLAEHVGRLDRSREAFLRELKSMSPDNWRRLRRPADFLEVNYEVTPEWAVFHLVEHEAGHAFQISSLKARGTRMLTTQTQKGRGGDAGGA